MKHSFERYCKDYENIENYEKALADNFKGWHCHHRLETHTSDGIRRPVDIPQAELMALGMYYHRPPEELIFLTIKEHNAYQKGKQAGENNPFYGKKHTEETRNKIGEAHKGTHHTEESKKKMSLAKKDKYIGENHPNYGKHLSEEHKNKIGAANKGNTNVRGTRWFNNGKINTRAKECPLGFVPGRLK